MCRCNKTTSAGFTLIELLIVMVIMSTTLALVIPFAAEQVDKEQQRAERQKIVLFLQRARQMAFFKSMDINLTFGGKQIVAKADELEVSLPLEHVSFSEEKQLVFNAGYQTDEVEIQALINYRNWTLHLSHEDASWLNAD